MNENPWTAALMELNEVVNSAIAASAGVRVRLIEAGFANETAEHFATLHMTKLLEMIYEGIRQASGIGE